MDADPDPQKAVTDTVETKVKQKGTPLSAEAKAKLLARLLNPVPQQAGPVTVSVADIEGALGDSRTPIGASRFALSVTAGTVNLYVLGTEEPIGHITGPVLNGVALVQSLKVNEAFKGQNLGKLLVVAHLRWAKNQAATHYGLGTEDTSGGFWVKYRIGTGGSQLIDTAIDSVGTGNLRIGK